jgi:hypothetical protein
VMVPVIEPFSLAEAAGVFWSCAEAGNELIRATAKMHKDILRNFTVLTRLLRE